VTLIDRVAALLDGVAADLLVVDAMMEGVTTAAWFCGRPVVQFATTIDQYRDGNRYPTSEFLKPTDSEESIRAAWRAIAGVSPRDMALPWTWAGDVLSRVDEFPFERALGRHVATPPTLRVALCPEAFDFPQGHRTVRYLSPGPPQVGALPESLRELASKAPIYVSFGSTEMFRPVTLELAEALAEAFPDHAIVCSADAADASSGSKPPNLHTFTWLPQAALLPHCACFVSHGGFNGIFESICGGTPLVVVPCGFDQPGLAARVEYHDAGIAVLPDDEQGIDVDAVIRAVTEVIGSARIRAGVAKLRSAFCRPSEIASYLHHEALGHEGNSKLAREGRTAGELLRRRGRPGVG
jgi:zeaxanthin glucosyltransferase